MQNLNPNNAEMANMNDLTESRVTTDTLESLSKQQFLSLIGTRIRKHRLNSGMSRKVLAVKSGVSERYLAQLELGKGNISILLLRQVVVAIDIKLAGLMEDEKLDSDDEATSLQRAAARFIPLA